MWEAVSEVNRIARVVIATPLKNGGSNLRHSREDGNPGRAHGHAPLQDCFPALNAGFHSSQRQRRRMPVTPHLMRGNRIARVKWYYIHWNESG
jgi:hypothetical protein